MKEASPGQRSAHMEAVAYVKVVVGVGRCLMPARWCVKEVLLGIEATLVRQ